MTHPPASADHAIAVHRQALIIDTLAGGPGVYSAAMLAELDVVTATAGSTADLFREIERLHTRAYRSGTFPEYWQAIRRAGVDVLSISVGAWGDRPFSFRGAVYDLGEWHRRLNQPDSGFTLIREPADLQAAKDTARTGILLGFQNCTQLERDVRNVETFHGLGVRMIQLSYNGPSDAGYGCTCQDDPGLTGFGRDLVAAMNDLGMVVDLSHCGPRTTLDAIAASRAPVAVSHSGCATVYRHARNKNDEVLRALADTGGYFGVYAVPTFLTSRNQRPSLDHMVCHIRHALNVAGDQRVGIGTDWGVACSPDGVRHRLQQEAARRGFRREDDFDFGLRTDGFETWAAGYPRITERLLGAGLTDHQVQGILGRNFQQLYHTVHTAAAG